MATAPVTTTVTELPESRVRVEAEVPARGGREARRAGRARARPQPARARLPRRQGAAAGRDPARRPRGGARRGGPRSIGGWYAAAIDAARHRAGRRARPRPRRAARRGRAAALLDRDRRAPEGDARRVQGARGRRAASPTSATRRSTRSSSGCASARPSSRPSSAPAAARRLRGDGLRRHRSTARRSPAARGATRWSSSAPAGSSPASRSSSRAPRAGEERTVKIDFPEDYGAAELAGKQAEFAVTVKEVKAKQLPELDDELRRRGRASTRSTSCATTSASGIAEAEAARIEAEFREAALDAAVDAATVEVPDALVEARARELWDQMLHSLSHQGISKETYLRISGRERGRDRRGRQGGRRAGAAPRGGAGGDHRGRGDRADRGGAAGGRRPGAREGGSPKKLLERLKSAGRLDALKEDLAQRRALDLVAESAKPIAVEQAQAREKLWTPGSDSRFVPARPRRAVASSPATPLKDSSARSETKRGP